MTNIFILKGIGSIDNNQLDENDLIQVKHQIQLFNSSKQSTVDLHSVFTKVQSLSCLSIQT